MFIIHVIPSISDEASGPSYTAVQLCDSMIKDGNELNLIGLVGKSIKSYPYFFTPFPLGIGPRRLGRSPAMLRWLDSKARSYSIDLIHNHSLWMMPNVYSGKIAGRFNIPFIVSPRGTLSEWAMNSGSFIKRIFWPLVQRPALSSVSCFHATAESEYVDIRRMGFKQPVAVIPNGIDVTDTKNIDRKHYDFKTLLFLGRIHPKKGLDMLLPAWRVVQDRFPEWQLRITGPDNGTYYNSVRRMENELRLKRVVFTGPLYGLKKTQAYAEADIFVLPTYSENFGISVAEALAAGTPAIVTKGAPWAGLVSHNCGWWIDIGIDSLVACLEEAMDCSQNKLMEMGQSGKDWMKNDFSWNEIAIKMADTYSWILHGGVKPQWVIES
jgi:glycosyltransferase involved in cell wall biosynthesis